MYLTIFYQFPEHLELLGHSIAYFFTDQLAVYYNGVKCATNDKRQYDISQRQAGQMHTRLEIEFLYYFLANGFFLNSHHTLDRQFTEEGQTSLLKKSVIDNFSLMLLCRDSIKYLTDRIFLFLSINE